MSYTMFRHTSVVTQHFHTCCKARVTFRVIKLGRHVIVNRLGLKYVRFHALTFAQRLKIITPHEVHFKSWEFAQFCGEIWVNHF